MTAKKFIPDSVGLTKAEIAVWMNDVATQYGVTSRITLDDLSDNLCQSFVNDLHQLMDEHVGSHEEDMVDARFDMILEFIEIVPAVELATSIREARNRWLMGS